MNQTYIFVIRLPSPSGRGRDRVIKGVANAMNEAHARRLITEHERLTEADRATIELTWVNYASVTVITR